MTPNDFIETLFQGLNVRQPFEANRQRYVVGRARTHLIEEPQSLLGKGKGGGATFFSLWNALFTGDNRLFFLESQLNKRPFCR